MSIHSGIDFAILREIRKNMQACILGKDEQISLLLTALLAEGHVLLEDVPGTGKTVMIKALAKSIQGRFRRIQCHPDLLPTDITGVSIYHPKSESFIFRPGPIMTHLLLVDEINRATTKTQSALLEAMEEKHVTADGEHYQLPHPFLLLATQNPIEFEGTYTLPEAQLDRFMMMFPLGYPDEQVEQQMLRLQSKQHPLETLQPVASIDEIIAYQHKVKDVYVHDHLSDYVVSIVRSTRQHPSVFLGASPRATISLLQASKAYAFLHERDYVLPDDIKYLVPYVLSHRLILHSQARMEGESVPSVLEQVLQQVKVPIGLEK